MTATISHATAKILEMRGKRICRVCKKEMPTLKKLFNGVCASCASVKPRIKKSEIRHEIKRLRGQAHEALALVQRIIKTLDDLDAALSESVLVGEHRSQVQ